MLSWKTHGTAVTFMQIFKSKASFILSLCLSRCPRLEGACTTSSCQNGGTCVDNWFWQQCNCKDGFTGKYCEKCTLTFTLLYNNLTSLEKSSKGPMYIVMHFMCCFYAVLGQVLSCIAQVFLFLFQIWYQNLHLTFRLIKRCDLQDI